MASNGSNGSLHVVEQDADTLPPGSCNPPFLCEGLEALAIDMGLVREQLTRLEQQQATMGANLSLVVEAVQRISLALGLGVKPS